MAAPLVLLPLVLTVAGGSAAGAAPASDDPAASTPSSPDSAPAPIAGGATFSTAPTLGAGRFSDVVRPGETLYYGLPLRRGQSVTVSVQLPASDLPSGRRIPALVRTRILNPLRQSDDDFPDATVFLPEFGGSTEPYSTPTIGEGPPFSEPGEYFLELQLAPDEAINDYQFDVIYSIEIAGEPRSAAAPSPSPSPSEPAAAPRSSEPDRSARSTAEPSAASPATGTGVEDGSLSVMPALIGAVGLLVGLSLGGLRSRRRDQPGDDPSARET